MLRQGIAITEVCDVGTVSVIENQQELASEFNIEVQERPNLQGLVESDQPE